MPTIAIVTGASSGLGKELVRQIDAGGIGPVDEIWAVGRSENRLSALVRTCRTTVRPFCLDLTDSGAHDLLEGALAETAGARVRLLVNNAGFGTAGDFALQDRDSASSMIDILMRAPVELAYRVLPYMTAGSRILNTSSVAAFTAQPRLAVYSCAKRFILDFSRALDAELGDVDIHVTAVCPKFMRTGFLDHPGDGEAMGKMTTIGFERVEDVAAKAIAASNAGRALCIPSPDMKAYYALTKVLPYPLVLKAEKLLGAW